MSYLNHNEIVPETSTALVEVERPIAELTPLKTLCDMLTYRRPSGSRSEGKFIRRFISPLGAKPDKFGNYVLRIGDTPVMFSSHTDSVHRTAGRQKLLYKNGVLTVRHAKLPKSIEKSFTWTDKDGVQHTSKYCVTTSNSCLGADDGVGCWIMREMALAGIPGLYVWHRQEESGGVGSSWIADSNPSLLANIQAAIAFDRRGTTDVITHQAGGRCCSNVFAASLADQLPGCYTPSSNGIFTDTANYTGLVGECTNISVGYDHEHTSSECLNLAHALKVRDAMIHFDYKRLELKRQPGEREQWYGGMGGYYAHGRPSYRGKEESRTQYYRDQHARKKNYKGYSAWVGANQDPVDEFRSGQSFDRNDNATDHDWPASWRDEGYGADFGDYRDDRSSGRNDFDAILDLVRNNPNEITDMLQEYGMDAKTLRQELYDRGAALHRI